MRQDTIYNKKQRVFAYACVPYFVRVVIHFREVKLLNRWNKILPTVRTLHQHPRQQGQLKRKWGEKKWYRKMLAGGCWKKNSVCQEAWRRNLKTCQTNWSASSGGSPRKPSVVRYRKSCHKNHSDCKTSDLEVPHCKRNLGTRVWSTKGFSKRTAVILRSVHKGSWGGQSGGGGRGAWLLPQPIINHCISTIKGTATSNCAHCFYHGRSVKSFLL